MVKFGLALSLKVAGTEKLKDIRFTFNLKLTSHWGETLSEEEVSLTLTRTNLGRFLSRVNVWKN